MPSGGSRLQPGGAVALNTIAVRGEAVPGEAIRQELREAPRATAAGVDATLAGLEAAGLASRGGLSASQWARCHVARPWSVRTSMTTHANDSARIATTRWRLDPTRSSIEFRGKMLWGTTTVSGRFSQYQGTLDLSGSPAAELIIDAASLDTENARRDAHLRSPDFFSVVAHPYLRYECDAAALDGERLVLRGRLHSRDVTLPLDLEPVLRRDGEELELEAAVDLDYREIGMSWGKLWNRLGVVSPKGRVILTGRLVRVSATPRD